MLRFKSQTLLHDIVMGLALALTLSLSASTATGAPLPDPGPGHARFQADQYVVTAALPSAVSGRTNSSQHQIIGARVPTAGSPLVKGQSSSCDGHLANQAGPRRVGRGYIQSPSTGL
jgi:hypothetical protein